MKEKRKRKRKELYKGERKPIQQNNKKNQKVRERQIQKDEQEEGLCQSEQETNRNKDE